MTLEVEARPVVVIKDGNEERLRMTFDDQGDLVVTQNGQNFYLLAHLHEDFRKGVAKLFTGRPVKRDPRRHTNVDPY